MVRGELRKELGRHPGYQVVTRLDVDAILKEMGFQQSGMVNDAQRKKVGDMTGAQYICVSTITRYSTQLYIEAYLVNVETGQMNNPVTQYAKIINDDYSTIRTSCNAMASEMLGNISSYSGKQVEETAKHQETGTNRDYVETAYGINMNMIWVEGGAYYLTSRSVSKKDFWSEWRVIVDGFYISMLEVTQSQWEKVMGSSIYDQFNISSLHGVGPDYPMYYVNWEEAMEFCRILSNKTGKTYTLPTLAQWQYAALGGRKQNGTKYSGSNMIDSVAWYMDNSGRRAHPCGTKQANALGIYDMSGNVWEWCKDRYNSKDTIIDDTNNLTDPSLRSERVVLGGSFIHPANTCRVGYHINTSDFLYPDVGFRVVCIP